MMYSYGNMDVSSCPMCGSTGYGSAACGTCFAPAELIQSVSTRDYAPKITGVLGPSNVGKTVYLGMLLDLLARGASGMHGVAQGAFSLAIHSNLMLSLERQRFPEKTPNEPDRWHWVHTEITTGRRGRSFDVVSPDVAGEAVAQELSKPDSNPTVRNLLGNCSGLVVLIDITKVVSGSKEAEIFAMQLVSYLNGMRTTKRNKKVDVPVALVFTKADLCEESIPNPEAFAKSNTSGLYKLCDARLSKFKFFASGVAGSAAWLVDAEGRETLVPLRIEPRGVIEPFAWLFGQYR